MGDNSFRIVRTNAELVAEEKAQAKLKSHAVGYVSVFSAELDAMRSGEEINTDALASKSANIKATGKLPAPSKETVKTEQTKVEEAKPDTNTKSEEEMYVEGLFDKAEYEPEMQETDTFEEETEDEQGQQEGQQTLFDEQQEDPTLFEEDYVPEGEPSELTSVEGEHPSKVRLIDNSQFKGHETGEEFTVSEQWDDNGELKYIVEDANGDEYLKSASMFEVVDTADDVKSSRVTGDNIDTQGENEYNNIRQYKVFAAPYYDNPLTNDNFEEQKAKAKVEKQFFEMADKIAAEVGVKIVKTIQNTGGFVHDEKQTNTHELSYTFLIEAETHDLANEFGSALGVLGFETQKSVITSRYLNENEKSEANGIELAIPIRDMGKDVETLPKRLEAIGENYFTIDMTNNVLSIFVDTNVGQEEIEAKFDAIIDGIGDYYDTTRKPKARDVSSGFLYASDRASILEKRLNGRTNIRQSGTVRSDLLEQAYTRNNEFIREQERLTANKPTAEVAPQTEAVAEVQPTVEVAQQSEPQTEVAEPQSQRSQETTAQKEVAEQKSTEQNEVNHETPQHKEGFNFDFDASDERIAKAKLNEFWGGKTSKQKATARLSAAKKIVKSAMRTTLVNKPRISGRYGACRWSNHSLV